jgi:hypothetical protein
MTAKIQTITTTAPQTDRTEAAATAVRAVLSEHLNGLPIATALGVLVIVKDQILQEARE